MREPIATICLIGLFHPFSGIHKGLNEQFFARALLDCWAVIPMNDGWKRHEDRFNAPAGLEAKVGPPIVEQIKLDISPPSKELKALLLLSVRSSLSSLDNRKVLVREREPEIVAEVQGCFKINFFISS
jgi:hypothetical protein